jgi:two-component system sensor histidine kinase RegB
MFDLEPTITLPWLVRLRWLFAVGQLVAWSVVRWGFGIVLPWWPFAIALAILAGSNLLLETATVRRRPPAQVMGTALLLDTVLLTVQLAGLGGASNPFTVMYLVYITLSAIVLSARWTTAVALLATAGFALLFAVPTEMHVHHSGPPLLNPHLQGMWAAFVVAAGLTAFFVRRISRAIATQREQIAALREAASRNARHASLATLAAGAAHELNNPLSTIAVAAHEACLRAKRLPDAASVAADLDLILAQVDRCQQILHRMAARVTEPDAITPVRTDDLVAELRRELGDRADRVDVHVATDAGQIAVPTAPVVQSLVALVKNALDASAPTERVKLAITRDGTAIAIEVADRGEGIPEEVLTKVGEPFFTTKAPGEGMGLGVFLAKVFFESHGGALSIESTPGVGTTARARLPVEVQP